MEVADCVVVYGEEASCFAFGVSRRHSRAHEFFGAAAVLEKARQAQAFAGERLRAAFAV